MNIAKEELSHGVLVRVQVTLSGREAGRVFLSGDMLIHLPLEGAQPEASNAPIPRMSIFLSELAATRNGITRVFDSDEDAETFVASVRQQLASAMEVS